MADIAGAAAGEPGSDPDLREALGGLSPVERLLFRRWVSKAAGNPRSQLRKLVPKYGVLGATRLRAGAYWMTATLMGTVVAIVGQFGENDGITALGWLLLVGGSALSFWRISSGSRAGKAYRSQLAPSRRAAVTQPRTSTRRQLVAQAWGLCLGDLGVAAVASALGYAHGAKWVFVPAAMGVLMSGGVLQVVRARQDDDAVFAAWWKRRGLWLMLASGLPVYVAMAGAAATSGNQ